MTTAIISRVRSTRQHVAFRDMTIVPAATPVKDARTISDARTGRSRITPPAMSWFWPVANAEGAGDLVRRDHEASGAVRRGSDVLTDRK